MTSPHSSQFGQDDASIIFLHLHKTGGMSLRGLFARNYPADMQFNTGISTLSAADWAECRQRVAVLSESERAQFAVFKGHMLFGLHEWIPRPCRYVTLLRQPVPRVVSYYRMALGKGQLPADHRIDPTRPDWNLGTVPELACAFDNGQTRALAAVNPDLPIGSCTGEHLEIAKRNIERHFAFVGLVEQFDLSLLVLQEACGWKRRFYVPDNVAPGDGVVLSPGILDAIGRLNQFDAELYRFAAERFEETVRSGGWKLQARHRLFAVGNAIHQALYQWRTARKPGGAARNRPRMRPLMKEN